MLLSRRDLVKSGLLFAAVPASAWATDGVTWSRPHVLDSWSPGPAEGTRVDDHGAMGDGETDDTRALDSAIRAAGPGGALVFTGGRTYVANRVLRAKSGQTWVSAEGWATLKLGPYSTSALTFPASKGDKRLFVADVGSFRVGQAISPWDGKRGLRDLILIASIDTGSGVLMLDKPLRRGFDEGVEVFTPSYLVQTAAGAKPVTLRGLRFDGNRAARGKWNRWELCRLINRQGGVHIDRCQFVNAPGDAISGGSKGHAYVVEDCTFEDLNGSAVHLSGDDGAIIRRCRMLRTNQKADQMAHAEGVLTWSAQSPNTQVEALEMVDCARAAFGAIGTSLGNTGIRIRDCIGRGLGGTLEVRAVRSRVHEEADLELSDCRFEACGPGKIRHGGGQVMRGVVLRGCTFVDSPLHLTDADVRILGCTLVGQRVDPAGLFVVKGMSRLDLEGSTRRDGDTPARPLTHPLMDR